MSDRWSRLAPLTGVLFGVLVVVAVLTNGSETPKVSASSAKVVSYYTEHRSEIETSSILFALAFLVLVLFAGALRSYLRRTAAADGLSALVLAGAVLMATGTLPGTGLEYGVAHNLHDLSPEAVKTLNFIGQELFLAVLAGGFIFGVCSGLAILRGAALPKWLGWIAIVIGIAVLIPPASFPALLAFLIWSIIVSILMYLRSGGSVGAPAVQPA
ncbi:MAG: hypothetical protein ACHQCH_07345 [Solirubrobacterales bacterium]|jgi:uncharacterized membrane protein YedE/YeeE